MTFPWDGSGRTSEDTSTNDRGIHIWHDADDNPEDLSVQSSHSGKCNNSVWHCVGYVLDGQSLGLHLCVLGVILCLLLFLEDLPMGRMQMGIQKPTQSLWQM
jgi:hypothetical protein